MKRTKDELLNEIMKIKEQYEHDHTRSAQINFAINTIDLIDDTVIIASGTDKTRPKNSGFYMLDNTIYHRPPLVGYYDIFYRQWTIDDRAVTLAPGTTWFEIYKGEKK